MTTKLWVTLAGSAIAALLLAGTAPGRAEPSDMSARTVKFGQGLAAPPAEKSKPAPRGVASQGSRPAATQKREWTLQDAMPDHSASMRRPENPLAPQPKIGRLPLQDGTVGFETETLSKPAFPG